MNATTKRIAGKNLARRRGQARRNEGGVMRLTPARMEESAGVSGCSLGVVQQTD